MKNTSNANSHQNRTAAITADVSLNRSKVFQTEASASVSMSSSPTFSTPLFKKKAKSQDEAKAGIAKTEVVKSTGKNDASDREGKKVEEKRQVQAHHTHDPSIKPSNKQEVKKLEAIIAQPSRPSNPFLKSSVK